MKKIVLLTLAIISLVACSPYVLKSSGALNGSDLTSYKTFQIQQIDTSKLPESISDTDLMRLYVALSNELKKRGYTFVKEGGDLTMHLGLSKKRSLETTSNTSGVVAGVGAPLYKNGRTWNGYNYYGATPYTHGFVGTTTTSTELVTDGVLIVDLVDNSDKNHVFYAQVSANIDGEQLILKDNEKLAKVAATAFKKFPIPAAK